jgi:hypothetical protein
VQTARQDPSAVTDRSFALSGDRALALSPERVRALKRRARWRRIAGLALLVTPALAIVCLDVLRRGDRVLDFTGFYRWTYLGAMLESTLLWAMLLYAASRRSGWTRWVATVLFVVAVRSRSAVTIFISNRAYITSMSRCCVGFMDSVMAVAAIGAAGEPATLAAAIGLVWAASRRASGADPRK